MSRKKSAAGLQAPGESAPAITRWSRFLDGSRKVKGVLLAIASVGAIASGFVGYYTTYQTVVSAPSAGRAEQDLATAIAVLPFVNMSSDKDNEYFSDGLSEELLNALAQVPQLRVTGRTSSFSFKGSKADTASIARKLNVGHILEGSVRKSGNTVRISAQLTRGSDSSALWSQTFDRQLTDVFKVQDEIAKAVVAGLRVKLLPNQQVSGSIGQTTHVEAYRLYLQGRSKMSEYSVDGFSAARSAYLQALALDPNYAQAYAELATMEVNLANVPAVRGGDELALLDSAEKHAGDAIRTAPQSGAGYRARSLVHQTKGNLAKMLADAATAVRLEPGASFGQLRYGKALLGIGQYEPALQAIQKSVELDPLLAEAQLRLGQLQLLRGNLPPARAAIERAIGIVPDYEGAQNALGIFHLLHGDAAIARQLLEKHKIDKADDAVAMVLLQLREGKAEPSLQALKRSNPALYTEATAKLAAQRGHNDSAFEALEQLISLAPRELGDIQTSIFYQGLHQDRRWLPLLRKLGRAPDQLGLTELKAGSNPAMRQ